MFAVALSHFCMRYLNAKSDKQREAAKSDLEQRFWVGAVFSVVAIGVGFV